MRNLQSFIIFSFHTDKPSAMLPANYGIENYSVALGSYKGEKETSFIVSKERLGQVCEIAKIYSQESILLVENNSCYLQYMSDNRKEYIGEWREVDKLTASKLEAYTEINGKFYTAMRS